MKKQHEWNGWADQKQEMTGLELALQRQVEEMAQILGIGYQNFEEVRDGDIFYVDKTDFIRQWWENGDKVTLITRPRRFGKTLMMSMVEQFFSVNYADRKDLFEGLNIWENEKYQKIQGNYPVLFLSFADIKDTTFQMARESICRRIREWFNRYEFIKNSGCLNESEKEYFDTVSACMNDSVASCSLRTLMEFMYRYYGKKVIILLDEYDTPMQEAYVGGYWSDMVKFIRNLFNATFKTNSYMERAILTGITRISKESVFSDLNNLRVVTTTSEMYANAFGFTEEEVFAALDEYDLSDKKQEVKKWYDGFTFGHIKGIYNPWSVIQYLREKRFAPYWANTSSNALVGESIRTGSEDIKEKMKDLMNGKTIFVQLDEQIVFSQMQEDENAVWSLLLASGYLKVVRWDVDESGIWTYELALTNMEVHMMFKNIIHGWFASCDGNYNAFIKALLAGDVESMSGYINRIAMKTFSFFDSGVRPSVESEPERFYHGFVLGLMVDLEEKYSIISNRESGFGRYDIMMEPKDDSLDAIIIEFKVFNPAKEKSLQDTVISARQQIEEKKYAISLLAKGILPERIRKYGFAFKGKRVLIG